MIKKQPNSSSQPTLVKDWGKLFEGKKFTDFTFKVDGEEIQVHKAILAGRRSFYQEVPLIRRLFPSSQLGIPSTLHRKCPRIFVRHH
jgi:hypothetical protein